MEVRRAEALAHGCVIRPSTFTVKTSTTGALPANTTSIMGALILVTIENGVATEVTLPETSSVDLGALLSRPTPAPTDAMTSIAVVPGGDFDINVTLPFGYGPATIGPGAVTHFGLTIDGQGGGSFIRKLGPALVVGDVLSVGTNAGGDLAGTLPSVTLRKPTLVGTLTASDPAVPAATCVPFMASITGARTGMTVAAAPRTDPGPFTWSALVTGIDEVQVSVCALVGAPLAQTTFDIRVVQ